MERPARSYVRLVSDLRRLLDSGVPIREALESLAMGTGTRGDHLAQRLLARVEAGDSLAEAMASVPREVSAVDVALVRAGESSGKTVEMLETMERRFALARELREEIMGRALYSLGTVVIAIVLLPLALLIDGQFAIYAAIQGTFFVLLLGLYLLLFRSDVLPQHSSARETHERLLFGVPWWGKKRVRLALSRLFEVLGTLLQAGVPFRDAIPLTADVTEWPGLRRSFLQAEKEIESGTNATEAFAVLEQYVHDGWRQRIAAAEKSGSIDAAFLAIAGDWQHDFRRSVRNVLRLIPLITLIVVGAAVLTWALSAMSSYYDRVGI